MKSIKAVAAAAVLAMGATGAMANDVNNMIVPAGGTTFFGALHTDGFDFTDVFTFNVAGAVSANMSLITIGAGTSNIDFVSADLNGTAVTLTPNGFVEVGSLGDTLFNGPLVLTVKGKSGAAGGTFASYSGTINVTAVPEPGTYGLLLAGLAAVGFVSRRKKA